ncbi:hypothetical protein SK128_022009 [Halocaridina rubra]|uniref:Uncharacterized protein n=1 Tax=Halocaridina rubra TaxID=373956 RepID=A0AAN8X7L8_HALRR
MKNAGHQSKLEQLSNAYLNKGKLPKDCIALPAGRTAMGTVRGDRQDDNTELDTLSPKGHQGTYKGIRVCSDASKSHTQHPEGGRRNKQ